MTRKRRFGHLANMIMASLCLDAALLFSWIGSPASSVPLIVMGATWFWVSTFIYTESIRSELESSENRLAKLEQLIAERFSDESLATHVH